MIIAAANDFARAIYDRMPVLLAQRDIDAWLTGKAGTELLAQAPNDYLRIRPVSKRVNATGRGDDDVSPIESMMPSGGNG